MRRRTQYSRKDDYMNNPNSEALPCLCFSEIYKQNIQIKIQKIDIFLKSTPSPYEPRDVADLLCMSSNELTNIMQSNNIATLDRISFFTVIQTSSSYICKLIQREWKYSALKYYTPQTISYIYELNLEKVQMAFKESGLTQVDSHNIHELFEYIYVPVMNIQKN